MERMEKKDARIRGDLEVGTDAGAHHETGAECVPPRSSHDSSSNGAAHGIPGGAHGFTPEQLASGMRTLRRAETWRKDNPQAWGRIVAHALDLASKEQPISAQALIESVRKKAFVDAHGNDTRTDNSFASIFARWLVVEYPQVARYVELRRSVHDVLMGGGDGR